MYLGYTSHFFSTVFGVINDIQVLFDGNTMLSYVPKDQPLKICVKEM